MTVHLPTKVFTLTKEWTNCWVTTLLPRFTRSNLLFYLMPNLWPKNGWKLRGVKGYFGHYPETNVMKSVQWKSNLKGDFGGIRGIELEKYGVRAGETPLYPTLNT